MAGWVQGWIGIKQDVYKVALHTCLNLHNAQVACKVQPYIHIECPIPVQPLTHLAMYVRMCVFGYIYVYCSSSFIVKQVFDQNKLTHTFRIISHFYMKIIFQYIRRTQCKDDHFITRRSSACHSTLSVSEGILNHRTNASQCQLTPCTAVGSWADEQSLISVQIWAGVKSFRMS